MTEPVQEPEKKKSYKYRDVKRRREYMKVYMRVWRKYQKRKAAKAAAG